MCDFMLYGRSPYERRQNMLEFCKSYGDPVLIRGGPGAPSGITSVMRVEDENT
jgi:hypothetical protein